MGVGEPHSFARVSFPCSAWPHLPLFVFIILISFLQLIFLLFLTFPAVYILRHRASCVLLSSRILSSFTLLFLLLFQATPLPQFPLLNFLSSSPSTLPFSPSFFFYLCFPHLLSPQSLSPFRSYHSRLSHSSFYSLFYKCNIVCILS